MYSKLWNAIRSAGTRLRHVSVRTAGLGIVGTLGGGVVGLLGGVTFAALLGEPAVVPGVAFHFARSGCIAGALVGFFGALFDGPPVGDSPPPHKQPRRRRGAGRLLHSLLARARGRAAPGNERPVRLPRGPLPRG